MTRASSCPRRPAGSGTRAPAGVRASLEESLTRLGLDRVDILYLHDLQNYDLEEGIAVGLPACAELRDEGLVDAVGVGTGSLPALRAAARTGIPDLMMAAGRYTLLDQSLAADVIPECRRHGIGIACASVFNSGLLAADVVPGDALLRLRPGAAGRARPRPPAGGHLRRAWRTPADGGAALPPPGAGGPYGRDQRHGPLADPRDHRADGRAGARRALGPPGGGAAHPLRKTSAG